jgi:phosphoribosylformylglycinamidine synthase PurS subunit
VKAKIKVILKKNILDPQGKAVLHAINDLNYSDVKDVRIGKYIEIAFNEADKKNIVKETEEICNKLLSNPIMENFEYEIEEDTA